MDDLDNWPKEKKGIPIARITDNNLQVIGEADSVVQGEPIWESVDMVINDP